MIKSNVVLDEITAHKYPSLQQQWKWQHKYMANKAANQAPAMTNIPGSEMVSLVGCCLEVGAGMYTTSSLPLLLIVGAEV